MGIDVIILSLDGLKRFIQAVRRSPAHPGRISKGASFLNRFAMHR